MSFIGGRLPRIKEDDEDSWKPGQVGTLGTELNKNINKWISENTWERIPEQYRDAITEGVQQGAYSGSHFADGTPKPIKSEWLMNLHPAVLKYKGARSVLSRGFNINPGLVDKGAIVGGTGKTLYNKLNQSTAAHQAVHQAGQNVGRNVNRLRSQAKFAKDQIQYATGDKLRPLTKKPSIYTNVEQVIDGPGKIVRRAKKIYQYHAGAIPFSEAMKRARELPARSGSEYWHQDSELALKKGSITDPNRNDTNKMMFSTGVDPYNPNYKPTSKKDLDLYGKQETDFNQVNSFDEGFEAAEASISAYPGKRWPGLDLKIGDQYVKFYKSKGEVKVLPYNKWHQLRRSPFKVPKGIKSKLQKHEGGQLDLLNPNNEIVKYDQGTVNQFIDYTNKELDYQRAVQRVTEKLAKKALEAAGLPYKRNKTNISVDKSHAVPRSKGGSGYTFLEYWRANQQAGARDILDDQVLLDLGIPRNWNEYFIRWHQEQGKGNPATDLGRLSEISWDDYDQASKGADINTIKIRRKTINHFIQRQLEDPTFADQPTLPDEVPPGMENWTNRDQFELFVRESKGFNLHEDVIGSGDIESTFNAKQFDLKWRAETFGEVDQLKSDIQLDKKFKKAKRQATKQEKLDQSKIRRQTKAQEDKGQKSVTDKLLGPKELRNLKNLLDKELPD